VTLGRSAWDPYPFILLNLFLSMLAAIQAPVMMMSQNRQDMKDRLRGGLDFDVKRAVEQASAAGAKRAVMLAVSAPFHSELMQPAQKRLEKDLRATQFAPLKFPLVTNVDAAVISDGDEAREALIRQVSLPVLWEKSMRELVELGTATFVEVGPGRVLSGVLRQIERSVHCVNVEDAKSLQNALGRLVQAQGESAEASS